MTAKELYQAGRLNDAVQALMADLRNNPADKKSRVFLFELLCFAGEFDRAEKQLGILAQEGNDAQMGTLLYRAAIMAERTRMAMFEKRDFPAGQPAPVRGTLNGQPFESLEDADPRLGPRLEVFAAGQYMWLPLEHVASIEIQPPKRLRDLLWIPALVRTGPSFRDRELGEVLLPVLSPLSFRHADDNVRLGRATVWDAPDDGEPTPYGQKMLLADGEEIPILEVRKVEIAATEKSPEDHAVA